MSNAKRGKVESCSTIKDGSGRLAQREDELRKIWKEHFEDLYNIDTQEQVAFHMCGLDGIQRGNIWMKKVKMGMGRRGVSTWRMGESGDCLASCMQMT